MDRGALGVRPPAARARGGAAPWRMLLELLSPAGRRARLTILILHRVRETPDEIFPNEMHAAAFRERMRWIASWCNVLPLADAVALLERGELPARAVAITFDDGYADNATVALPILREASLPATFFVSTSFLDGGIMWNDAVIEAVRRAPGPVLDAACAGFDVASNGGLPIASAAERKVAIGRLLGTMKYLPQDERQARVDALVAATGVELPRDLMMTGEQVRELARAGMGIGGHTMTHPILTRLDASEARREIAEGRDRLQSLVGQPVTLFAYPNGKPDTDYGTAHVRMVQALGFRAAVSTAPGAARCGDSPFELPRFTPWGNTPSRWATGLARNLCAREAARAST